MKFSATILTTCLLVTGLQAELTKCYDEQNVVASVLVGDWVSNTAISSDLRGISQKKRENRLLNSEVSFTHDEGALPLFNFWSRRLGSKKLCYYEVGFMTSRNQNRVQKDSPYLLVQDDHGNPRVRYLEPEDGYDSESFIVMAAASKKSEDALLFIGGDFNNQPMGAFQRANKVEAKFLKNCVTNKNVLGSAIYGKWIMDEEATKKLRPTGKEEGDWPEVTFTHDESVLADFKPILEKYGVQLCQYAAGHMSIQLADETVKTTFFASNFDGNPVLVTMKPGSKGRVNLGIASLAAAENPEEEILYLGGDNNNQGMTAYKKVVESEGEAEL